MSVLYKKVLFYHLIVFLFILTEVCTEPIFKRPITLHNSEGSFPTNETTEHVNKMYGDILGLTIHNVKKAVLCIYDKCSKLEHFRIPDNTQMTWKDKNLKVFLHFDTDKKLTEAYLPQGDLS